MEVDNSPIDDVNPKVKKNNDYTNACVIAILLVVLIVIIGLYFTYSQTGINQIGGHISKREQMVSNRSRNGRLKSCLKRNTSTYPRKRVRFDLRRNSTRKFNKNDKIDTIT